MTTISHSAHVIANLPAAPGQLIDIGGRRLHLQLLGEHHPGPTVVLIHGLGDASPVWAHIAPALAQHVTVVVYDRAGAGWSDAGAGRGDARSAAADLVAALERVRLAGPYVLAGHSYGGAIARIFAADYPQHTAAVALIDAMHPEQLARIPQAAALYMRLWRQSLRIAPWLAACGVALQPRPWFESGLPLEAAQALARFERLPRHLAAARAEALAWEQTFAQLRATGPLGSLPLSVVSAGEAPIASYASAWAELQQELAALSRSSDHHTIADADHLGLLTRPTPAAAVVEALRGLLSRL